MQPTDRIPPQSKFAEQCVLGSMLRDRRAIDEVVPLIPRADAFYFDAHQKVFDAIMVLNAKGSPVDAVLVGQHLGEGLADIGGFAYLAELWEAAPTAANAEHYARIVREKGLARALIHVCSEIMRDAYDSAYPAEQLLENAERSIMEIADGSSDDDTEPLPNVLSTCLDRIDKVHRGEIPPGLPIGFLDLDSALCGWQSSELVLLGARPSIGKTALALSFLRNAALSGHKCLFVTLEQSKRELGDRLLSRQARINSHALRTGRISSAEAADIAEGFNDYAKRGGVCHVSTNARSVMRIGAAGRRLQRRQGLDLVIVDYLQLIESTDRRMKRYEQVGEVGRDLKQIARELGCPLIALCQLNRESESRADRKPMLSDLRDSGELEQHADTVLLLHRPNKGTDREDNTIEVLIEKNRNGECKPVTLAYIKNCYQFENYAIGEMS